METLEKRADFVIADHLRKDCPPGALSYQFIEDSIKHGAIQEEDKYEINQSPMTNRVTGLSKPAKATRTPYTNADDAVLAQWVLSRTNISGNAIYQQLEQINNRHTWQSWRDRWSHLAQRREFSEKDDKVLVREVLELEESGRRLNIKFFQELAKQHPGHSWQDWKTHWSEVGPQLRSGHAHSKSPPPRPSVENSSIQRSPNHAAASRPNGTGTGAAGAFVDRAEEIHEPSTAVTEKVSAERQNMTAHEEDVQGGHSDESDDADDDDGESQEVTRADFYDRLNYYKTVVEPDLNTEPSISDRPVDLWLLRRTVQNGFDRGGIETDWDEVAVELGLSPKESGALQECFNTYVGFFSTLSPDDDNDDSGSSDEAGSEVQGQPGDERLLEADEEVDVRSDDEVHISLPSDRPSTSRKRPAVETSFSTPNKRKKRSRHDEIPSTPEERLGIASFGGLGVSPSLSTKKTLKTHVAAERSKPQARKVSGSSRQEPETQDFGFDNEVAGNAGQAASQENDEFDISPSQQLFNDVAASDPIPFSPQTRVAPTHTPPPVDGDDNVYDPYQEEVDNNEQAESQGKEKIAEINEFIQTYRDFGYPRENIIKALMSTSICMPLASAVLKHMRTRKEDSPPKDWEGVWTDSDDKRLQRVDRKPVDAADKAKQKRYWDFLVRKHTSRRIEERRDFLSYMSEANGGLRNLGM
ncbi:transcription factor [Colletotrichum karsti]|uniref:DNA-binding protein RAP1 n=1 Tax=Colletotrichum karsti TaxID=1095194 RepID=A0A9P6I8T7_9PEZI|nr:transcription factor [Colletotrichum karsti]KAF9876036.1 transcription factor [Colletotrichum karsti]